MFLDLKKMSFGQCISMLFEGFVVVAFSPFFPFWEAYGVWWGKGLQLAGALAYAVTKKRGNVLVGQASQRQASLCVRRWTEMLWKGLWFFRQKLFLPDIFKLFGSSHYWISSATNCSELDDEISTRTRIGWRDKSVVTDGQMNMYSYRGPEFSS